MTSHYDAKLSNKYAYESIGKPFPWTETKIVDSSNKIVDLNVDGELCVRGFNVISEYWGEPEKTSQSIDKQKWLHTGDICQMDSNGYIYFKSRSKELIIRGGVNIYPGMYTHIV
jgi:long-subunit acyl-CoA synthetase (AMP-forming)